MKIIKNIIVILIFLLSSQLFYAQGSAEIFYPENPNDTLIHLGPCYLLDTLYTDIILNNTGDIDLFMNGQAPSLIIYASPNQKSDLEFNQFNRESPGMNPGNPFVLKSNSTENFVIRYIPSNPLINPLGINEANLQLALLSVNDAGIIEERTFLLRVNKTDKYLDGYYNEIFLDSVYVDPVKPYEFNWKVKSTWSDNVIVEKQELFSQNAQLKDEITVSEYNLPMQFPEKYKTIDWDIYYSPKDVGIDSSLFIISFKPLPDSHPDSIDQTSLKIRALGVQQDIEIINSNYNFSNDTLKLGDLTIGRSYNIITDILNSGNLSINSLSESIKNELNDDIYSDANILEGLINSTNFKPDSVARISFDFTPVKYGNFVYRYEIRTDIFDRKIFGTPASAENVYLYISGRGISPRLTSETDTLNFNNIILNSIDCPSERDTLLRIANNGNSKLRISDIITYPPFPASKFLITPNEMDIQPGKDTTVNVTFVSNDNQLNEYVEKLIFITNQYPPNDSIVVYLKAKTIPPVEANLSISRHLKAKPGSIINIPILIQNIEDKPAAYATKFITKLRFNSSLMKFLGTVKYGTASEKSIAEINDNFDELEISLIDNEFFDAKDTLIILRFKTYLGAAPSTELSFVNPVFGDNNCSKIMNTIVSNGLFMIDSVCGIEYKALPFEENQLVFGFYEDNNNSGQLYFEIPYEADVSIEIFDIFGNRYKLSEYGTISKGTYNRSVDISNINNGVYLIRFKFDKYYLSKKVLIGK